MIWPVRPSENDRTNVHESPIPLWLTAGCSGAFGSSAMLSKIMCFSSRVYQSLCRTYQRSTGPRSTFWYPFDFSGRLQLNSSWTNYFGILEFILYFLHTFWIWSHYSGRLESFLQNLLSWPGFGKISNKLVKILFFRDRFVCSDMFTYLVEHNVLGYYWRELGFFLHFLVEHHLIW